MKYFYQNAALAYLMQENQGIQLVYIDKAITLSMDILHCYGSDKLYVHPESMALFEPQKGDLITYLDEGNLKYGKVTTIGLNGTDLPQWVNVNDNPEETISIWSIKEIIQ